MSSDQSAPFKCWNINILIRFMEVIKKRIVKKSVFKDPDTYQTTESCDNKKDIKNFHVLKQKI